MSDKLKSEVLETFEAGTDDLLGLNNKPIDFWSSAHTWSLPGGTIKDEDMNISLSVFRSCYVSVHITSYNAIISHVNLNTIL